MLGIELLIIYFSIYSFIGWVCEVLYCSILSKKLVNRGFLVGPVCPIYGVGALFVIWLLKPVEASLPLIFLGGLVITSTLEYFTGWLLEVFFSTRWWDYRNQKFNIAGRVCLRNSILFGVLSVALMKGLYPLTVYIVGLLPDIWVKLSSAALLTAFIVDGAFTVSNLVNLNGRLKKLYEFTEDLKKNADILEWFNESVYRLIKAFPDMKSKKYDVQLNHLKEALKELKQKAKE